MSMPELKMSLMRHKQTPAPRLKGDVRGRVPYVYSSAERRCPNCSALCTLERRPLTMSLTFASEGLAEVRFIASVSRAQ